MPRVKRGVTAHRRHKKVFSQTKGQRASKHNLYRRAQEAMLHALSYATADRRARKSDFRRLWIIRINAAARLVGMSYSQLINGLTKAGVDIDRKVLADLAVNDEAAFGAVAQQAKLALQA